MVNLPIPARTSASAFPEPSAPAPMMRACLDAIFCCPSFPIGKNNSWREYRLITRYSSLPLDCLLLHIVFSPSAQLHILNVQLQLLISLLLPFLRGLLLQIPRYLIRRHLHLIPSRKLHLQG